MRPAHEPPCTLHTEALLQHRGRFGLEGAEAAVDVEARHVLDDDHLRMEAGGEGRGLAR